MQYTINGTFLNNIENFNNNKDDKKDYNKDDKKDYKKDDKKNNPQQQTNPLAQPIAQQSLLQPLVQQSLAQVYQPLTQSLSQPIAQQSLAQVYQLIEQQDNEILEVDYKIDLIMAQNIISNKPYEHVKLLKTKIEEYFNYIRNLDNIKNGNSFSFIMKNVQLDYQLDILSQSTNGLLNTISNNTQKPTQEIIELILQLYQYINKFRKPLEDIKILVYQIENKGQPSTIIEATELTNNIINELKQIKQILNNLQISLDSNEDLSKFYVKIYPRQTETLQPTQQELITQTEVILKDTQKLQEQILESIINFYKIKYNIDKITIKIQDKYDYVRLRSEQLTKINTILINMNSLFVLITMGDNVYKVQKEINRINNNMKYMNLTETELKNEKTNIDLKQQQIKEIKLKILQIVNLQKQINNEYYIKLYNNILTLLKLIKDSKTFVVVNNQIMQNENEDENKKKELFDQFLKINQAINFVVGNIVNLLQIHVIAK